MKPGVEPVRIAQSAQVAPGLEEGGLHGICGLAVVAEDEPLGRVQPPGLAGRQRRESVDITCLGPNHEVSLHRSTCVVTAVLAAPV